MLVAAAVCPHPPLLVRAPELAPLRAACRDAISALRAAEPDVLVVVGGADTTAAYDGTAAGTLQPWGFDLGAGDGDPVLPLSLTIGRLLLGHAPGGLQSVAFDAAPADCLALGQSLAERGRLALLVMADGSACLTSSSPGRHEPAARPYQDLIASALAEADPGALAALDPAEADRLWLSGRAALQVLAGAAGTSRLRGRLLEDVAPFGVGYFAAVWR
ncbi:hypothetical protein ABT294_12580 [Nonomuraea sp. NPDC000554]|uniref:hypothetical protein n=1 Tax=Nonomuraea sp. NPDC000554 TaxID=3154259 RepID=UPI0033219A63